MSRHSVLFALLSFAHLSHFFRTDVASHCWHSHIWHSHSCLIRTVDPFALLAFALLASHWCRSHFCLSHSCRTSGINGVGEGAALPRMHAGGLSSTVRTSPLYAEIKGGWRGRENLGAESCIQLHKCIQHTVKRSSRRYGFVVNVPPAASIARNVTGRPANHAGARSTLKNRRSPKNDSGKRENRPRCGCCGERRMKSTWRGEQKKASGRLFLPTLGSKRAFSSHFESFLRSFSGWRDLRLRDNGWRI